MLISIESLSKYHNEKCILDHVSFTIEAKQKWAFIGINGTGKSTFLRILAGLGRRTKRNSKNSLRFWTWGLRTA